MKIVIDIPDDFIEHWNKDRFKDSLCRMKADADTCELCSGNYEAELCDMLITAFSRAKELRIQRGGLVSLKEVYWFLGNYFIPRFDINHVVYDDINVALHDIPIVIEKENT